MIIVVDGEQGGGKTYFCVLSIKEFLEDTKRHIYTNMPLYIDQICLNLKDSRSRLQEYLSRIHLFVRSDSEGVIEPSEIERLKKDSPLYMSDYSQNLLPYSDIRNFHNHISHGAVIFIDEVHNVFSSLSYREKGADVQRELLMNFLSEHRHYRLDVFLILPNINNADVIIRNLYAMYYHIYNGKDTNILPWRFFKGFTFECFGIQFFKVIGYKKDSTISCYEKAIFPCKRYFKFYNSHSESQKLTFGNLKKQNEDDSGFSSPVSSKSAFKKFISQFGFRLVIIISLFIGGIILVKQYKNMFFPSRIEQIKKGGIDEPEKDTKNQINSGNPENVNKGIQDVASVKVISFSSSYVKYSDGKIYRKGDFINGSQIKKIFKNCVSVDIGGELHNLSFENLRK